MKIQDAYASITHLAHLFKNKEIKGETNIIWPSSHNNFSHHLGVKIKFQIKYQMELPNYK